MRRLEGISTPPAPRPAGPRKRRPPPKRDTEFKPYQLKPKRGTNVEPFLEPPIVEPSNELPPGAKRRASGNPKKLKRMKKKLDELNRKIRHSKKRHNGLIHKQNSLRKVIEGLKLSIKPPPSGALPEPVPEPVPEPDWTFKEHEQAFGRAYRSYRVDRRPKMDVDTFLTLIWKGIIKLIKRELNSLNLARIQTTTWIRFVKGPTDPTSGDDD